jgi:hypothetical protein
MAVPSLIAVGEITYDTKIVNRGQGSGAVRARLAGGRLQLAEHALRLVTDGFTMTGEVTDTDDAGGGSHDRRQRNEPDISLLLMVGTRRLPPTAHADQ